MGEFVTILTVNHIHELGLTRSLLEANNIPTFVKDEYLNQSLPLDPSGANGVKLLINRTDLKKAIQILKENNLLNQKDWDDKDLMADTSFNENLFTEWSIFGNFPPVYKWLIIAIVFFTLIALILFSIFG